jgi:2-keto-3-deoxy-L-fuconate dehydrogenase
MNLDGKVAVITGATGGMGSVACRSFCEAGAKVVGSDLDAAAGAELETKLRGDGYDFSYVTGDVREASLGADIAKVVEDQYGRLDVLYNNAGVVLGKHVLDTTEEEWDLVHDVIVKGTFLMTKALVPLMKQEGSVINVSSSAGIAGAPNMSAYSAAKGAIVLFTKSCAIDFAPGVRVNAICPGAIDTRMPRDYISTMPKDVGEAAWKALEEGHLVGRLGTAQEVVNVALFLASDLSSNMTGTAVVVDGGWTAK